MKTTITFLLLLIVIFVCHGQNPPVEAVGGEYIRNVDQTQCLTHEQRQEIFSELNSNILNLQQSNRLAFNESAKGTHPFFEWPVQKATNTPYNQVWAISNYVDHNPSTPNQLTDYNCGTRSYDTNSGYNHQGLDVFSWPFSWFMMDNDEAEIVAAAPGQIIAKSDGNFDRSCDFSTTTPWNAVYVQHSDGSIAWYGHLKNGSLTTKNVGDMVSVGEFLGVMGSSGISTGPHLHFEVFTDNTYTQLVDPYSGTCNTMNTETWWQNQKPYLNPAVNAVLTHSAPPVFNTCPTTETTNRSDDFDTNDVIYFGLYLKDQATGTSVNLKVIRPDNSELYNWNFNLTADYYASWWYWNFSNVFDMNGAWKWEATYNGQTVTHVFNITGALSVDEYTLDDVTIYPNPVNDIVSIKSKAKIVEVSIVNTLGKNILTLSDTTSGEGIRQMNLTELANGVYFVTFHGEQNQKSTIKLIKTN
ncbi:peptidoglycan DD-metalloendopeptidase family protein [Winogradskyella tangerina]|uniref:peptidoglycan DD-metalloendopeptidase family protein n=1 Tax=Winogradskyella tangerina TaxID=2023240 RepID=UPI0018E54907|nr:peptidoglycan DD-metalloendopeptidase family protein [Winogradskyella tangerina]